MPADKNETTLEVGDSNTENVTTDAPNPTIEKGFFSKEKYSYIFSKEFLIILLMGQFLSFCITSTIVTNGELFRRGANFPTIMTFLNYVFLFIVYAPVAIYKRGVKGWWETLKFRWWKYLILCFADVEGNYFIVKAYAYTSLLSIMLLDTWSTPCVVLLSLVILKVKYHWGQYLAVVICLLGIGAVIGGDLITGNQGDKETLNAHQNLVLGDIFCILSGTFYAISNVTEEHLIKRRPLYEVLSQMGFFGILISTIQIAIFERKEVSEIRNWSGPVVGLILAYNIAMFCLYTVAPFLFRRASATFFNLSLLTSDFYSLIFALIIFHAKIHALYPVAFIGTMVGLALFNIFRTEKSDYKVGDKDAKDENLIDESEDNEVVRPKDVESNKDN